MTKQTAKTAAPDLQTLFDMKSYEDACKTAASMNERMASLAIDAGTRATDMANETAKEALSNMRELTQVRDDPAAYAQAFTDFAQKQTELFTRTFQSMATDMQKVSSEASDFAAKTSEDITGKATAAVESAVQKAGAPAGKAA